MFMFDALMGPGIWPASTPYQLRRTCSEKYPSSGPGDGLAHAASSASISVLTKNRLCACSCRCCGKSGNAATRLATRDPYRPWPPNQADQQSRLHLRLDKPVPFRSSVILALTFLANLNERNRLHRRLDAAVHGDMKDFTTDLMNSRSADDRALEFDFGIRAPVRRLVVQLGEKGWSRADIAYALREIAEEVEMAQDPEGIRRPAS